MSKRLLQAFLDLTGVVSRRWERRPAGVYCFNFHRVGNDDGSAFHPNLFSCTGARFAEIVQFLQREFEVIDLERVRRMVCGEESPRHPCALITFDDGYLENYEVAFPILRGSGCSAVFFVTTNFVEDVEIPWWDRIAWKIWHMGDGQLRIPGVERPVTVAAADLEGSIRRVLRAVKDNAGASMAEKVQAIEGQVESPDLHSAQRRLFLGWEQIRKMRRAGMEFGSHTKSHEILSHLTAEFQRREIVESKAILERELGEPVDALAYPVGGFRSYTPATQAMVRQAGYRMAFIFEPGINRDLVAQRYELRRMSVDRNVSIDGVRRLVLSALHK